MRVCLHFFDLMWETDETVRKTGAGYSDRLTWALKKQTVWEIEYNIKQGARAA